MCSNNDCKTVQHNSSLSFRRSRSVLEMGVLKSIDYDDDHDHDFVIPKTRARFLSFFFPDQKCIVFFFFIETCPGFLNWILHKHQIFYVTAVYLPQTSYAFLTVKVLLLWLGKSDHILCVALEVHCTPSHKIQSKPTWWIKLRKKIIYFSFTKQQNSCGINAPVTSYKKKRNKANWKLINNYPW